ncbi:MAG: acetyl-coenzyme A synthetase, partial [Planctomycetes bacterium]|nr:acetyl-coenzyme A synthetase [Planctomycetota bacterium]
MSSVPASQLKDLYPVVDRVRAGAHIASQADYQTMYDRSVQDPVGFWGDMAKRFLDWRRPFDRVMDCSFNQGLSSWFIGGQLNVSENCIDRHLEKRADQIAILW